jgi:putative ABC transport system permease protein
VPVIEISDSYLGLAVYADIRYLSRLIDEELAVSGVQLAIQRDPQAQASLYRKLKQIPTLQTVTAKADMIKYFKEAILDVQNLLIDIIVAFAGVVFFGSILNASLVSLAERQREISTLRVLGYGPWRIGGLLFRESMITTVVGALLGMPLGYWLTAAIAEVYASDMFRMPVLLTPGLCFETLVIAISFGVITQFVVQKQIHAMNWLDALKTQE